MNRLKRLEVKGFRSFSPAGVQIEFGGVNVLIGANGAGKSNLIALFELLNYLTSQSLAMWVGQRGGAASNLYYGPRLTPQIEVCLDFDADQASDRLSVRLFHGSPDRLIFAEERIEYQAPGHTKPLVVEFGSGHEESKLINTARIGDQDAATRTVRVIRHLLSSVQVFHFHDTSSNARVMGQWALDDRDYLKADGGNLAPFLRAMRDSRPEHYQRLVDIVRQVAPFFGDFELDAGPYGGQSLLLRWREIGSDVVFGPHQLSDGTLRFILLTALLAAPSETLPAVIVIDEPELGLHPVALDALASMIRGAAEHAQVILTTQSATLLDHFEPQEIITADRRREGTTSRYETVFTRRDAASLAEWLNEYTLGELWEKGVLGGRPLA